LKAENKDKAPAEYVLMLFVGVGVFKVLRFPGGFCLQRERDVFSALGVLPRTCCCGEHLCRRGWCEPEGVVWRGL